MTETFRQIFHYFSLFQNDYQQYVLIYIPVLCTAAARLHRVTILIIYLHTRYNCAVAGLVSLINQLYNYFDDTKLSPLSEAYAASLYYYGNVQQAASVKLPGAKAIYDDLKLYFPRTGKPVEAKK